MGNIESGKWRRQEIQGEGYQNDSFYYFKREMNSGRFCIKWLEKNKSLSRFKVSK